MSTNGVTTKTVPNLTNGASKDSILSDIRRELENSDLSSNAGSTSSGTRRRRHRRNKNKAASAQGPTATASTPIPRLAETKPVRLQIGLNLDIELELKAKIQGDISLTLLVEKRRKALTAGETEKKLDKGRSGVTEVFEACYVRLGTFSFRQKWIQREVSRSLMTAVVLAVAIVSVLMGFLAGWMTARSRRCCVIAL